MRYLKKLAAVFVMIMAFAALTATVSAAEPDKSVFTSSMSEADVSVKTAYYHGKGKVGPGKVTVTVNGKELEEGVDYKVVAHPHKAAGVYTLRVVSLSPQFTGSKSVHWILKDRSTKNSSVTYKKNTMAGVKCSKLKKDKVITLKGIKGTSYKYTIKLPKKSYARYIKTNKKSGRIRLKAGIKKGVYKVTVKVYRGGKKVGTQTIRITIK